MHHKSTRVVFDSECGNRRFFVCNLLLALALATSSHCIGETVTSPDERIRVDTTLVEKEGNTTLQYSVDFNGLPVLSESTVAFTSKDNAHIGNKLKVLSPPTRRSCDKTWRPLYGERSHVVDCYNELTLHLHDEAAKCEMQVTIRCYDAGVAFQTRLTADANGDTIEITNEPVEYHFGGDHIAWATTTAQGEYAAVPISKLPAEVERPLVIQTPEDVYVALGEAALVDYARMKFKTSSSRRNCVQGKLTGKVHSDRSLVTPWRVIMVGDSPGHLMENNDIFLNLNEPCAIEDTSWIRPGKVLRDNTLTNDGARACIEFARRHNFRFVEFDAGWYGNEYDDSSDATTVTLDPKRSDGPFDLKELVREAAVHDIGIIVYVNRRALEKQLDELLPLYKEWGIAGVKYGFVNVGSQEWTSWLHEAVRKAADHQLMVDVHDEYRPTGYSRTYPNLMTQEGVRGDEATPASEQTLTTLFTRCLAGPTDFTICYFNPRVDEHWSQAHQLAKAVCFYSPWQFVFWYDTPLQNYKTLNSIVDTQELEFFTSVPTTWDETRVIHGSIGEYAVIARRSGDEWYIGALNNSAARKLEVTLDFLDSEKAYEAVIYCDDSTVQSPTGVKVSRVNASSSDRIELDLKGNCGQAIRITPIDLGKRAASSKTPPF